MHGELNENLKVAETAKNTWFRALLKPLQSLYESYKNQKQLKYMPIPGRYLRKTFECIRYTGNLIETKKCLKKWRKWQKTLNLGPFWSSYKACMYLTGAKNSWNICQYLIGCSGKHFNSLDRWKTSMWAWNSPKSCTNKKMLNLGPFEGPLQTPFVTHRNLKQ